MWLKDGILDECGTFDSWDVFVNACEICGLVVDSIEPEGMYEGGWQSDFGDDFTASRAWRISSPRGFVIDIAEMRRDGRGYPEVHCLYVPDEWVRLLDASPDGYSSQCGKFWCGEDGLGRGLVEVFVQDWVTWSGTVYESVEEARRATEPYSELERFFACVFVPLGCGQIQMDNLSESERDMLLEWLVFRLIADLVCANMLPIFDVKRGYRSLTPSDLPIVTRLASAGKVEVSVSDEDDCSRLARLDLERLVWAYRILDMLSALWADNLETRNMTSDVIYDECGGGEVLSPRAVNGKFPKFKQIYLDDVIEREAEWMELCENAGVSSLVEAALAGVPVGDVLA